MVKRRINNIYNNIYMINQLIKYIVDYFFPPKKPLLSTDAEHGSIDPDDGYAYNQAYYESYLQY